MPLEIERKYLVTSDAYKALGDSYIIKQAFLFIEPEKVLRVRIIDLQAFLTFKAKGNDISRPEYEYEIPLEHAEELIEQFAIRPFIEKRRYRVPFDELVIEVDEFFNENEGLVVAEVELESEDQQIDLPEWIGQEVSDDVRYNNAYLVKHPYQEWKAD